MSRFKEKYNKLRVHIIDADRKIKDVQEILKTIVYKTTLSKDDMDKIVRIDKILKGI